jgi:hypothetical protein
LNVLRAANEVARRGDFLPQRTFAIRQSPLSDL